MWLQRNQLTVSLLLVASVATLPQLSAAAGEKVLVKREAGLGSRTTTSQAAATYLAQLGEPDAPTKDAPVDGKDGLPHAGPFVETAAERGRKKAKENGKEAPDGGKNEFSGLGSDILPESNEGVMDDKSRSGPKEGQRGTEGGISEKSKTSSAADGKKVEKTPEKPKEAPPLPHSEEKKLKASEKSNGKEDEDVSEEKEGKSVKTGNIKGNDDKDSGPDIGGLTKPADLPEKPHDVPHPVPIGSEKSDPLAVSPPKTLIPSTGSPDLEEEGLITPFHSFVLSFTMIIVSEIGDKTFLVAALMAMKHPPFFVFSAAFPALVVMTIGSAIMGHAAPMLLPPRLTNFAAAILFLVFGAKMVSEGRAMSPDEGVGEEMAEVEAELEEKEAEAARFQRRRNSNVSAYVLEGGRKSARLPTRADSPLGSPERMSSRSPSRSGFDNLLNGAQNLFSLLLSPAWVQTFVMTFLGEWGDRSQIATIAMAAGQNYWSVTVGALAGHSICTGIAVIGGRAIAGRVSMRTVTLGGATAFLVFGFIYLAEALYYK